MSSGVEAGSGVSAAGSGCGSALRFVASSGVSSTVDSSESLFVESIASNSLISAGLPSSAGISCPAISALSVATADGSGTGVVCNS